MINILLSWLTFNSLAIQVALFLQQDPPVQEYPERWNTKYHMNKESPRCANR